MSSDKNPEVVGCDASIMKNVWEIREREYGQKLQQEQERVDKSALSTINKDWENRLAVRLGKAKRVERKVKPVENQDSSNVWKSKLPQAPPSLPHGAGLGPRDRPGAQRGGPSSAAPHHKDNKGTYAIFSRVKLLMSIAQTQPSAMVWGKSWRYNKSMPPPEEGAASDWGECWMFATHQPYSEPGKPWLNGPNLMDPLRLHLWKKDHHRLVETQALNLALPTEEWQMSWRKPVGKKSDRSSNDEDATKTGSFTSLLETQRWSEPEWSESWMSTKPASQDDGFTALEDDITSESIVKKQHKNKEMSFMWEECWKFVNHYDCNKSKVHEVRPAHSPEWAGSWRTAMPVSNNLKKPAPSQMQDHNNNYADYDQQEQSPFHKVMVVSHKQKNKNLYLQLCEELSSLSEWSKSWQVTKNNSKPCEELEEVLKVASSRIKAAFEGQKVEKNTIPETDDPHYEQLKHTVIYHPRRELTQSGRRHLQHLKNDLPLSNWKDSWKTLNHQLRVTRRRMRPDPSRPFQASERAENNTSPTTEWKDSWRFTCQPLGQDPELWQRGWAAVPQIRVDRARDPNHFAAVELPKNGPSGEPSWTESWRSSRHQNRPTSQGISSVASRRPHGSQASRSVSHWQEAWMVSETEHRHDRPSYRQWMEAWRCSGFSTERWIAQLSAEREVGTWMETESWRERISLQKAKAKMSQTFDNHVLRERYPEKQWNGSWRADSLLKHQPSNCKSSEKSTSGSPQQHCATIGHGSKWGLAFRIANPMPEVDQPWVKCSPNLYQYPVMWSSRMNRKNSINATFSSNPATFRLWGTSCRFLQVPGAKTKDKPKSKEATDPWVITTRKTKSKKFLYANMENNKQSDRKWAGCHLLGKTQPNMRRGAAASRNKLKMEDESKDDFVERWAASWRFLVEPKSQKKQMTIKVLVGWDASWKFLLPPYQPMNGPKARS